nr:immunoglobulin heavy chain junction region [Mus musculus]
CTRGHGEDYW